jgi:thiol:disulfide interchange protein DsbD
LCRPRRNRPSGDVTILRDDAAPAKVPLMLRRAPRHALLHALVLGLILIPTLAFAGDASVFEQALSRGLGPAFAVAFVSGLGLTLTPCVYPMIAITVSVFGGADAAPTRGRAAALSASFVLGMASLFTGLGVFFAISGQVFGSFLGNAWVLRSLAAIFVALALSMFGAWEFALPSSLQNRLASAGGLGFGGAFVLGLVTSLVAAPCTGPFMTGLLLWISTTKNVLLGAGIMFVFALGLGAPFFLVGTFAVSLPKGGSWMLAVKWFFGVALALLAFHFLRIATPALQLQTKPSTFALGVATAAIVLGLILAAVHVASERRGSTIAHLGKPAHLVSIPLAVAGASYLLAAFLVPPPALAWLASEEEAIATAQREHKPVVIDFGAEWCAACKELTKFTFADERVRDEGQRFVALQIDATDDEDARIEALKGKYRVVGLPTVVLLDGSGHEVKRFNEFVEADVMLEAMRAVH